MNATLQRTWLRPLLLALGGFVASPLIQLVASTLPTTWPEEIKVWSVETTPYLLFKLISPMIVGDG